MARSPGIGALLVPQNHDKDGKASQVAGRLPIGAPGFEPGTSPTRTVRATRLRHAPTQWEYSTPLIARPQPMPASLFDIVQELDRLLSPERFEDYCHNGLQVP